MVGKLIIGYVILSLTILSGTYGHPSSEGIQFIENRGQWDKETLYRAKIRNGYLSVTRNGLQYLFYDGDKLNHLHHKAADSVQNKSRLFDPEKPELIDMHAVKLKFLDRSDHIIIQPGKKQKHYFNYFLGKDPDNWASGVPVYSEINIKNIYPGIDMKLYSDSDHLKYDLIAEPGADIARVRFLYEGVEDIKLANRSLYAETSLNTIIENTPYAYQIMDKDTINISCNYRLNKRTVSFDLPLGYDNTQRLVIDPLLVFSTYSGSTGDNWGNTATFDNYGNVYSGGTIWDQVGNALIPVSSGAFQKSFAGVWDIALFKFDSTGSDLLFGTYLGGSDAETPFSLIVDKNDDLLILGITGSDDFPATENSYSQTFSGGPAYFNVIGGVNYVNGSDLFIAKISSDGSELKSATYLGGTANDGINSASGFPLSRNYGDEFRGEINIDNNNQVYMVCNTSSEDFPIINGYQSVYGGGTQDAVIAKFSEDLSKLTWSTFLGGIQADAAYGIRISKSGSIYITGGTMSNDFPVTQDSFDNEFGGDVDGFVSILSPDGQFLETSTFLGTNQYDQSYFIDLDPDQNVYVLGQTSGQYPVSEGVYTNPNSGQFLHKLSSDLQKSLLSTVIGSGSGIPDISPTAFLVNECGNIFLSGWGGRVNSPSRSIKYNGGSTFGMPITDDAYQSNTDGSDFYLMVLEKDAKSLLYGTYLGAITTNQVGEHVDGGTSRFDKRGLVYHAICACQDNSQFPTTPEVWSNTNNSPNCNNGVFKFDLASLKADISTDSWEWDDPGVTQGCFPFEVVFLNTSIGGKLFQWDLGDGSDKVLQDDSLFYIYEDPGSYEVTLSAFDENTCLKVDVARKKIHVFEPSFVFPQDQTICQFDQARLQAGGADEYSWFPEESLNDPHIPNPLASPDTTTTYYLYMKDFRNCETFDSLTVTVIPEVTSDFQLEKIYDCFSHPSIRMVNLSERANTFIWDFGDGMKDILKDSVVNYHHEEPGTYRVRLEASADSLCAEIKEELVEIKEIFVPNIFTPNNDSRNETFTILTDAPVEISIFNRWGKIIYQSGDYQNDWKATDLPTGVYYYDLKLEDDASCQGWIQVLK